MTNSTRAPEGQPLHCDVCGVMVVVETSPGSGDARCPACGRLLWRVRNRLATELNLSDDDITLTRQLQGELVADSVDFVELVMTIEDEFDVKIPDAEYGRLRTVGDVAQLLLRMCASRDSGAVWPG